MGNGPMKSEDWFPALLAPLRVDFKINWLGVASPLAGWLVSVG